MLLSSPKASLITFSKTGLIEFYLNSQLITDPKYPNCEDLLCNDLDPKQNYPEMILEFQECTVNKDCTILSSVKDLKSNFGFKDCFWQTFTKV